ncbi:hypothetical protein AQ616_17775 [Oceanobacillus sp. E9]|uniref:phage scaffolding protein n=1 Tax=Oceanobacillus sp. E9 TaxID=1742575 RepID=UPI00084EAB41|nr:phage scaffolding protein [Oceanobacillus sp. E9]OEH53129.1 hypothetical protein AQ616_17775 [Oceanobacillus sp. E9]
MKRDFLKELGLEDEAIDKIMAEHGKSVNDMKEKAEKADTLESQVNDYKQQIADRDTQLKDLGEKAKGNEDLTAEIDRLKEENETTKSELEQKLEQQAFDHKLENTLKDANVKNPTAVKALLNLDEIKLDGDKLRGLDTQLEGLKESDDYLFQSEQNSNDPSLEYTPGSHQQGGGGDDAFAQTLLGK